jgi:hypothetical protein
MDEMQLNEILSSYRDAINALIERADAQDEMINAIKARNEELEHLVFDEVINPAKEAMEKEIYNAGLNDFTERYGDQLAGYNEKLRPIEGEDFDIMQQAYDGYNGIEGEKPNQDIYVEELKKVVDKQLDDIRKAIGAPEDSEVSVTQKEDGETVVEVDGKEVQTEEAKPEAKAEVEIDTEGEAEESDPEELAKLEEELLKMAK